MIHHTFVRAHTHTYTLAHIHTHTGNSHKPPTGMAKRSMARLTRMHVDGGLLMQLSPEERQLLNQACVCVCVVWAGK